MVSWSAVSPLEDKMVTITLFTRDKPMSAAAFCRAPLGAVGATRSLFSRIFPPPAPLWWCSLCCYPHCHCCLRRCTCDRRLMVFHSWWSETLSEQGPIPVPLGSDMRTSAGVGTLSSCWSDRALGVHSRPILKILSLDLWRDVEARRNIDHGVQGQSRLLHHQSLHHTRSLHHLWDLDSWHRTAQRQGRWIAKSSQVGLLQGPGLSRHHAGGCQWPPPWKSWHRP